MFDKASGGYRHKSETQVQLQLAGAAPIEVTVFHVNGERLTDLLNDPRGFIPVRKGDGAVMIVAKTQIVSILESNTNKAAEDETIDTLKTAAPAIDIYEMLHVSRAATDDEVRAAYKARIKAVHPDSIESLGLDEELKKAALHATQKVNYAYRKIMRERQSANEKFSEDMANAAAQ